MRSRSQKFLSSPAIYEWRAFALTSTTRRFAIFAIPPPRHRSPPTKADDRRRPSWSTLLSGREQHPPGDRARTRHLCLHRATRRRSRRADSRRTSSRQRCSCAGRDVRFDGLSPRARAGISDIRAQRRPGQGRGSNRGRAIPRVLKRGLSPIRLEREQKERRCPEILQGFWANQAYFRWDGGDFCGVNKVEVCGVRGRRCSAVRRDQSSS